MNIKPVYYGGMSRRAGRLEIADGKYTAITTYRKQDIPVGVFDDETEAMAAVCTCYHLQRKPRSRRIAVNGDVGVVARAYGWV